MKSASIHSFLFVARHASSSFSLRIADDERCDVWAIGKCINPTVGSRSACGFYVPNNASYFIQ